MKHLKILGLLAAVALIALAAASSASATILCETNTTPCNAPLEEERDIHTTVTVHAKLVAGFATVTCTEVEKTEDYRRFWWNKVTTDDYTNCSGCSVATLSNGEVEYKHTSGANGTLIGKGAQTTFSCSGVSCIFGTAATGTTLGTITGGSPATVALNAKLPYISGDASNFVCTLGSGTASFTGSLEVTKPAALYVVEK